MIDFLCTITTDSVVYLCEHALVVENQVCKWCANGVQILATHTLFVYCSRMNLQGVIGVLYDIGQRTRSVVPLLLAVQDTALGHAQKLIMG